MVKVVFIINSLRQLSNSVNDKIELAKKSIELQIEIVYTKHPKHASDLALHYSNKVDIVVAVGGDGTNNEVLNGMMASENQEKISLMILPNGTGNDFSRNLKELTPIEFIQKLELNQSNKIDIGELIFKDKKSFFLNIADIGFGADVVNTMSQQRRFGLGGKLSYVLAIIRTFFTFSKKTVTYTLEKEWIKKDILMIAFCNGTTFGHGLNIFPKAKINNGQLGFVIIGNVSLLTYLSKIKFLKKGQLIQHPQVEYHTLNEMNFDSNNANIYVEGDGEILGKELLKVKIIPNELNLIH